MSVILDALKKLDREKTARGNGPPNIAFEILRPDLPHHKKRIMLYLGTVSLATAAITYATIANFGFLSESLLPTPLKSPAINQEVSPAPPGPAVPSKILPSAPIESPVPNRQVSSVSPQSPRALKPSPLHPVKPSPKGQQAPPVPPEPIALSKPLPPTPMETPALGQKGPPVPLSGEPVRDDQDTVGSHPPKIQKDTETQANTTSPGEKKTGSQIVTEERQGVPEIAGKPKNIPTESPTTPSSLKVSGIVWSEDPSNRLAVINGISVTEGAFIEGIKVLEIYATRVRFLYNDQPFEVPLGTTKVMK